MRILMSGASGLIWYSGGSAALDSEQAINDPIAEATRRRVLFQFMRITILRGTRRSNSMFLGCMAQGTVHRQPK